MDIDTKLYSDASPVRGGLLKWLFDRTVSFIMLVVMSPLIMLIILSIWISGIIYKEDAGPAIYRELRMAQNVPFMINKFRIVKCDVMRTAANERKKIKKHLIVKFLEGDPENLTRVGRILKKFYMDELPQLWNIFVGEISFVGSRPWPIDQYKEEVETGVLRKQILIPGLVGPVQCNKGRWEYGPQEVQYDNDYITAWRSRSKWQMFRYDISMIIQAFRVVFEGKGY